MKAILTSIVIGLCILAVGRTASADNKKLVVVVAKGSKVTNLSREDLKRCFLGEAVSAEGKPLAAFNLPPSSPERAGFDQSVLGMSPEQVARYWIDRKVRGQGAAPRALPSAAHVARVAAKFPGAIGYLLVSQMTSDVQAVSIDGIPYTDDRYNIVTQ